MSSIKEQCKYITRGVINSVSLLKRLAENEDIFVYDFYIYIFENANEMG